MDSTLYLQGEAQGDLLFLPGKSLVVLFSLQTACLKLPVNIVIVQASSHHTENFEEHFMTSLSIDSSQLILAAANGVNDDKENFNEKSVPAADSKECVFKVEAKSLMMPFTHKSKDECHEMVRRCSLPVVFCPSEKWCVSGLAASLRHVLKLSIEQFSDKISKQLLGFRLGCLQSCSEVSCWTKFCEIEAPEELQNAFTKKGPNECCEIFFPSTILRYNNHLSKPLILHNALKKKQEYYRKLIKNKEELEIMLTKKLHDLPDLEHCFAEGLDMTIADVILYVCFRLVTVKLAHLNFETKSPLVSKWLKLLSENKIIQRALPLLGLIEVSCEKIQLPSNVRVVVPDVVDESLYKSDPGRARIDISGRMTSQQEIDRVTLRLAAANIEFQYNKDPDSSSLHIPWSEYPKAVHPQEGNLPLSRLERKCQQLENVARAVASLVKPGYRVVDFCAGGGHVALLIAYKFPDVTVLMVENKVSSLERAKNRARLLHLTNVEFYQCNLDYFESAFDVGVCLHACGQATDMILEKCYRQQADFVCVPCCYGSIKPNSGVQYPRSRRFQQLLPEILDYLTLCHAADQTHGADHPSTAQGQLCMRLVDGDRLTHAQQLGYRTSLHLMVPASCSPKNHVLVGTMTHLANDVKFFGT